MLNFGNKNTEYRATLQHVSSSLAFLLVSMELREGNPGVAHSCPVMDDTNILKVDFNRAGA